MIFIITGVDGTGKTTLFNNLINTLNFTTFVKEPYPGEGKAPREARRKNLELFVQNRKDISVVYDRASVIEDFIYEPIIGSGSSYFEPVKEEIASLLRQTTIIHLVCNLEQLSKRITKRGDNFVDVQHIEKISEGYAKFFQEMGLEPFVIDTSKQNETQTLNTAMDLIRKTNNKQYRIVEPKRPKLAHIVPVAHLEQTASNHYHMCLAHLVLANDIYSEFYKKMSQQGKYVLIDNGAAEHEQLSLEQMSEAINMVKPSEVILMDTLSDGNSTYKKTIESIEYYGELDVRFMAVPQGTTFEEWKKSAEQLVVLDKVNSIGVSKFLTITTQDPYIRFEACKHLEALFEKYGITKEVHLLGNDTGPHEANMIFARFDFVRGCDTALSFLFAQRGVEMGRRSGRQPGEIDFIRGSVYPPNLEREMNLFNKYTLVENEYDPSWLVKEED